MGKLIPNDSIPSSSSSISRDDGTSVHSLTKDFFRLASCCAIERFPFIKKWKTNQEVEEIEYLLQSSDREAAFLRASIFEHMPPTIRFHGKTTPVKQPTASMKNYLLWAQNVLLPIPMRHILRQNHFIIQPMDEEGSWLGYWGKHWKTDEYKSMKMHQKVNHYPGSFHIGRKDKVWTHIVEFTRRFGKEFDVMPRTFLMPDELSELAEYLEDENHAVIIKPPASARGTGISIVSNAEKIPELDFTQKKCKFWVAQEYILNPYLIGGKKFDLRVYAYVPTLDPLTIYIYDNGLVRFASLPYDNEDIGNQYIHLTNYSINKHAVKEGISGIDVDKWSLDSFFTYLDKNEINSKVIQKGINDMVVKTIISCESYIRDYMKTNNTNMTHCYELFGFDILMDTDLKLHLLEVNISPSLQAHTPVDIKVKWPLVRDVLNMCRYAFPVPGKELDNSLGHATRHCDGNFTLACKEKICRVLEYFQAKMKSPKDIISETNLTGADLRCLCEFEDRYNCRGNFEIVYPAKEKSLQSKYFEFIRNPTYFDILMHTYCIQRFSSTESEKSVLDMLHHLCYLGNHIVTDDLRLPDSFTYPYVDIDYLYSDNAASETSTSSS